MIATQERRRAPRVPFNEEIMVRTQEGELFRAQAQDLSESGMLLQALVGEMPKKEQHLWLSFTMPRVSKVLQVGAEVVRNGGPTLGVRFIEMPPVIRRMVRTYVFTGVGQVRDYEPN